MKDKADIKGLRSNPPHLSDDMIVALYFERNERAIKETDVKYGKYLYTIAYNIVYNQMDCEECLNDTYLSTWNAIPPHKPPVLQDVVAAASEEGGVVTNGMSFSDRAGENANSAVLVTVQPKDFPYPGALGGVQWQREIEEKAYRIAGGFRAPAQRFGDFLEGRASQGEGNVRPTYLPGVVWCDLHQVLPQRITDNLKKGILDLDNRLKGFADPDAVLTGPETRSSSPVRIVRDESGQTALRGLYPAGEGAGYAGGIMSAAVDGMEAAEAVLKVMM